MKLNTIRFFLIIFCSLLLLGNFNYASVQNYIDYAQNILSIKDETILTTMFIPDKEPKAKKVLLGLIYNEKKRIQLAQFLINDSEIAEALCDVFDKGVKVSVIADSGSLDYRNQRISKLLEKGIEVLIYKRKYSCMHNKFYIFENNFFDKPIVWMGSANATFSGFEKNQESIIIFNDPACVKKYKVKFKALRKEMLTTIKNVTTELVKTTFDSKNFSKKFFRKMSKIIQTKKIIK